MARARKTKTDSIADTTTSTDSAEPEIPDTVEALPDESLPEEEVAAPEEPPEEPTVDEPVEPAVSAPEAAEQMTDPLPPRRGGFVPLVLGGVVAAGLGFGAATYVLPDLLTSSPSVEEMTALKGDIAAQNSRISELTQQIDTLKGESPSIDAVNALTARADALTGDIETIHQSLVALEDHLATSTQTAAKLGDRLATLEKRPVATGEASASALEAFGREMDEMRAEIEAQRTIAENAQEQIDAAAASATSEMATIAAEADRLRQEAETIANGAAARAALSRLRAALDSGGALGASLAELTAAGIDVPQVLSDQAQGVPSLLALQNAFPAAARDALAVSLKETAGDGTWERVGAFLRSQSGARSLSPRAGDDADAVLSRAEAALKAGDLAMAISEIAILPPQGQARMAEWVTLAERRISAVNAFETLAGAME